MLPTLIYGLGNTVNANPLQFSWCCIRLVVSNCGHKLKEFPSCMGRQSNSSGQYLLLGC
jgi:hypothetical protein